MEYLSRTLGYMRAQPGFKYHPKCKRINLTHLMFADDLLIFVRADHDSVKRMMNAFQNFSKASGLEVNNAMQIANSIQMPIGTFPFRYLGVPLATKKLTYSQCKPIDRITARAQGWMTHCLSYAGRLQLIKVILQSMQNYWAQIFPLPKK